MNSYLVGLAQVFAWALILLSLAFGVTVAWVVLADRFGRRPPRVEWSAADDRKFRREARKQVDR